MNELTISRSGTAYFRDMAALGKSPGDGWASSPNAAYYASLDAGGPAAPSPVGLPTSLTELMKFQKSAVEEKNDDLADVLQTHMAKAAAEHGMAPKGNIINVKA